MNNRFITENRFNFVHPKLVNKRTAAEMIGIDKNQEPKNIEDDQDILLLTRLRDQVTLSKRDELCKSDKENKM